MDIRVVFFGTPLFSAKVLRFLLTQGVNIVAVITKPDKPKGRSGTPVPTPVKEAAQEANLPFYQPEIVSELSFAPTLAQYHADLFVVVAYGEIIKQHLLDMPKLGCINLHASLLPKYRGAAPIHRAILNGETETGVTIMHMVKKMDAGEIIKMVEVPIGPDDRFPDIQEQLCVKGSQALLDVIELFNAQGTVSCTPQDHDQATYAPKIELEECEIHWKLPAKQVHDLVRAVFPEPAAWCYVTLKGEKKRLKVLKSQLKEDSGPPGTILSYGKKGLTVACGQGSIQILELQLEGKRAMKAEDLMLGIPQQDLSF